MSTDSCKNGTIDILFENFNSTSTQEFNVEESEEPFQISYIYLATSGLFMTLIVSNICSLLPRTLVGYPSEQQRRKSLYSTRIWEINFFQKYFSISEKDPINCDQIVKFHEKQKMIN